tara:strand:- start:78 stop:608 length:531 start_codon:yes stop_codon:yes gene_type:complete
MANPKPAKIKPTRLKGSGVKVEGMRDFRKELRQMTEDGGKDGRSLIKQANGRIAKFVVDKAIQRAHSVGPLQVKAAQSMKAKSTSTAAQIVAGDNIPFFDGAEFGAHRNLERNVKIWGRDQITYLGWKQFKDWKKPGNGNTGYFLFPTLRAESETIKEMWGREFDEISSKVFPDRG